MGILLSVLFHEMLCGHTDTGYNILKQMLTISKIIFLVQFSEYVPSCNLVI